MIIFAIYKGIKHQREKKAAKAGSDFRTSQANPHNAKAKPRQQKSRLGRCQDRSAHRHHGRSGSCSSYSSWSSRSPSPSQAAAIGLRAGTHSQTLGITRRQEGAPLPVSDYASEQKMVQPRQVGAARGLNDLADASENPFVARGELELAQYHAVAGGKEDVPAPPYAAAKR
ncbi:MAG: hypothetical protein M1819_006051 [Sarea resinae]|nr:MAG: hypothetical protein M1819_006051 [Sarea resinae]